MYKALKRKKEERKKAIIKSENRGETLWK